MTLSRLGHSLHPSIMTTINVDYTLIETILSSMAQAIFQPSPSTFTPVLDRALLDCTKGTPTALRRQPLSPSTSDHFKLAIDGHDGKVEWTTTQAHHRTLKTKNHTTVLLSPSLGWLHISSQTQTHPSFLHTTVERHQQEEQEHQMLLEAMSDNNTPSTMTSTPSRLTQAVHHWSSFEHQPRPQGRCPILVLSLTVTQPSPITDLPTPTLNDQTNMTPAAIHWVIHNNMTHIQWTLVCSPHSQHCCVIVVDPKSDNYGYQLVKRRPVLCRGLEQCATTVHQLV